ncbi:unnamed protein product [Euphydryas editha]|uniref:Uncharacterized protein n=1 Tax=Euphydryas editha TaxID=104508 RepID=A0AAU9V1C8_EUPED|nr:unnamed protein product [Euphydryas editha]
MFKRLHTDIIQKLLQIVAAAIFACAAAAPSAGLLATTYSNGFLNYGAPLAFAATAPVAVARSLPVAAPTIPPGDIQGAAIDAHVEAVDHTRAAIDNAGQINDQVAEIHGKALNAAEDNAWQAVSAAQTAAAQVDGAAASIAPAAAEQLARGAVIASPVTTYAASAYAAPLYAAHGYAPAAISYAAPAFAHAW